MSICSLLRILQLSDKSIRYKILHFVTKFCQNIKNVEITLWDNVAQYSDVEIISKGMSSSRSSSRLILNFIINPMIMSVNLGEGRKASHINF